MLLVTGFASEKTTDVGDEIDYDLLMAPMLFPIYGMAISFYTELGYNIIDRANFVSMRMYFNFRMYDRMNYKYKIGYGRIWYERY